MMKPSFAACSTLILVGIAPALVLGAKPRLSYFDRLSLTNWRTVKRIDKSGSYWKPTAMLLIAAKPAEVMATFMDINSHHRFMPKVKKARVVRRVGKREVYAVIVTRIPWPMANAWVAVKYNWRKLGRGGFFLKWVRHRGSMKRYWGSLQLLPWGNGWTLAVCQMQAVPDQNISRSRLNSGIVWGTKSLVNFLRAEVDRRRRASSLKRFNP